MKAELQELIFHGCVAGSPIDSQHLYDIAASDDPLDGGLDLWGKFWVSPQYVRVCSSVQSLKIGGLNFFDHIFHYTRSYKIDEKWWELFKCCSEQGGQER